MNRVGSTSFIFGPAFPTVNSYTGKIRDSSWTASFNLSASKGLEHSRDLLFGGAFGHFRVDI
jgi:hypothetical protein